MCVSGNDAYAKQIVRHSEPTDFNSAYGCEIFFSVVLILDIYLIQVSMGACLASIFIRFRRKTFVKQNKNTSFNIKFSLPFGKLGLCC